MNKPCIVYKNVHQKDYDNAKDLLGYIFYATTQGLCDTMPSELEPAFNKLLSNNCMVCTLWHKFWSRKGGKSNEY